MNVQSDRTLKGKVALITGASRGIGQACAISLAQAGVHCILVARNQSGLMKTDNEIRKLGLQATLLTVDFSDPYSNQIDLLGPSIASRFQQLDILIHAANHWAPLTPMLQIEDNTWDQCITANLTSCRKLIRTLYPLLNLSPIGKAIFVQGDATPKPYWANITPINAAVKTLIECWKQEIASISKVDVIYYIPSPTSTLSRKWHFPAENSKNLLSPCETAQEILSLIKTQTII